MSWEPYYDMDGRPISPEEAGILLRDMARRHVAIDVVDGVEVSTVGMVVNHQYGPGPPVIFETMTFADDPEFDGWSRRYSTREQAELGHEQVCATIRELAEAR